MKNRSAPRPAAWCLCFASLCGIVHGETLRYWNASGTGGDEIWGTSPGEKNWNITPGAPAGNTAWPDTMDDVAVFQDLTGGVVTLSEPLQTAGIIQNGADYTINAGILTLVPDSAATDPFIKVQSGILTIDSVIAGNNGLVKNGGGTLILTGTNTFSGTTLIQDGRITLSGSLTSGDISISSGATLLDQNGGLSNSSILTNAGTLTLDSDDTAASYISNGGRLTAGPGTLSTTIAALNGGSTLAGLLDTGTLTSNGAVLVSGTATTGSALIQSGTQTLSGTLASDVVVISSGNASLLNQNSGLSSTATLTNAGSLTLNADDTIAAYFSNGGTLTAGPGTLSTTNATLSDGSNVSGLLDTGTLTSSGAVDVRGTISADSINITEGTLTNTGTLGTASTLLNLNQGATLVANGSQRYSLLTTSGPGAATWVGDLKNISTVAPGGLGAIGILKVQGNFAQSPDGTLELDLSAKKHDLLDVSGNARFNGSLVLNQLGSAIAPFVPVTVVSASDYAGNITSFSENLDGAVWFNPGNGSVTRIEIPNGRASFFGSTRNQTSTWISLYDDVIAPGTTNIQNGPGGYGISSGIADTSNPDLLWALSASFAPTGLNPALLNRLSPEVYGGMSDYATQATRSHQRSALSAPALDPKEATQETAATSSKSGAKGAILDAVKPVDWEFFAAVDYFTAGTESSPNEADYDFDGTGVLVGARTRPWDRTLVAAYFGVDSGTMEGNLIDADAFGCNYGVTGEYLLDEKSRTRLRAAMSYGSYFFDGSRQSVSASAAGWAPGEATFENLDVDAFDLFIGVDGVAWKKDALTLIPSAGMRYSVTSMDSFNESTGAAAGSPIALDVQQTRHESMLLEFGMLAQFEVNAKVALWGESGVNVGLLDDERALTARFSKGSRQIRAEASGLEDDSLYLGCGALYQISESISASIGYRADIRSEAAVQQELRISSSWRF